MSSQKISQNVTKCDENVTKMAYSKIDKCDICILECKKRNRKNVTKLCLSRKMSQNVTKISQNVTKMLHSKNDKCDIRILRCILSYVYI